MGFFYAAREQIKAQTAGGVLETECRELIQEFFRAKRRED
jgi:hypothetical protein